MTKQNTDICNKAALSLLQDFESCGMLTLDSVYDTIMATKREQVRKIHPYAITPPPKDGARWQTFYKDEKGQRKNIRAQTEQELLDKLVVIYFTNSHLDKKTFYELYREWLEYKRTLTNSPNTIKRHSQHYKRYFEDSKLHGKTLRKIDSILLESECNRIVREFNISRKEWLNIKTILSGMFEFAVRKKYLSENPMKDVRILVKFRQMVKKTGKTQTYNNLELEHLNKYLDGKFAETDDTSFLAVKLNFLLGLRVGELVALRWADIEENHIHVQCEEIRDQEANTYMVAEHTKTYHDRYVVLVPKALDILEQIPHTGEYIFMRNNERLTSRQIAYVLEKYARDNDIPVKSTHKMRKTYASNLAAKGVPLDAVRELLGHSDLSTTLGYIYNPLTDEDTYNLIKQAL